jgi:glutamate synthase (NADPH/NADH) large chain
MTGGTAVFLGPVGDNFGAGMTGGMAFVYDPHERFKNVLNPETLVVERIASPHWEQVLRGLIAEHARETDSAFAASLLRDWDLARGQFWHVVPKEMFHRLPEPMASEEAMFERA